MTEREMIERVAEQFGLTIQGWSETDDGETAAFGRFVVTTPDYEDDGLYEGDEGDLSACVVGAKQYHNQRVSFTFMPEGCDGGPEVRDLYALESV